MKNRLILTLAASVLLLAVAIMPLNMPVLADNGVNIYSGTGSVNNIEPITVTPGQPTIGDYTGTVWTIPVTGGTPTEGAVETFAVSNNSDAPIDVTATSNATTATALWYNEANTQTVTIEAHGSVVFTLTVRLPATVAAGSYPITFNFTR